MDELIDYMASEEAVEQSPEQTKAIGPVVDKDEEFVSKFNQLTAKEKEILKKQNELKKLEQDYGKYNELKSKAKDNPMSILEHLGLSIDDIGAYLVGQESKKNIDPAILQLQEELQALKQEKESEKKQIQQAEENKVVAQFNNKIAEIANSKNCELIQAHNAYSTVYSLCEEYYNQTGELLDVEVAVDTIEQELEEQAEVLLKVNKIRNKFAPATANAGNNQNKQAAANKPTSSKQNFAERMGSTQQKSGFTLSNDLNNVSKAAQKQFNSDDERLEYAASFLNM